jgi:hypothetical protein
MTDKPASRPDRADERDAASAMPVRKPHRDRKKSRRAPR